MEWKYVVDYEPVNGKVDFLWIHEWLHWKYFLVLDDNEWVCVNERAAKRPYEAASIV